jgi:hypothetical protein
MCNGLAQVTVGFDTLRAALEQVQILSAFFPLAGHIRETALVVRGLLTNRVSRYDRQAPIGVPECARCHFVLDKQDRTR